MAVIRIQKTDNYTVMSNHHLRNKEMSLKAKGLMSLMLSLPPTWDYSIGGLVAICKESHTSIRSALKELEQNQYLIRERKNNEKGYFTYEYTLYEIPLPHIDKQYTDLGNTDKGHKENRRQINKELLNKKELNKEELKIDKKGNLDISVYNEVLKHFKDIELKALLLDYIEMRFNINSPLSVRGLSMLINRLSRLSNFDRKIQKEMLENAILNNWKSVYLPKEEEEQTQYQKDELYYKMREFYEEE